MSRIGVVSVGDTPTAAIAALAEQGGQVRIVRRCGELAELLAACQNGIAQAAVIATPSPELTATLVDRLHAVGVCVLAVHGTPEEARRLRSIGATAIPEDADAGLLVQSILAALDARRHPPATGYAFPQSSFSPMDDAGPAYPAAPGQAPSGQAAPGHPASTAAPVASYTASTAAAPVPDNKAPDNEAPDSNTPDTETPPATAAASAEPHSHASEAPPKVPKSRTRKWFGKRHRPHAEAHAEAHAAEHAPAPSNAKAPGTLVAVWGPIGSPGRTTVAMNLAAEHARQGRKVLLIDADSYGASIAAALGLLDESASFAQACRAADQGNLTPALLRKTATEVVFAGGALSLLTGLTRPDRWPELRAAAVERVLAMAGELAELVIVDCGFSLENDEELSYDTVAPRRNAATLTVLARADLIVAVGSGDTIGIPRLIRGLAELGQLNHPGELQVVVNKVRRRAAGPGPEKALEQAWQRFGPSVPISHFLPWDPELADRALLEGRLLLEVAPESALRRAIRAMGCADDQRKVKIAGSKSTARARIPG